MLFEDCRNYYFLFEMCTQPLKTAIKCSTVTLIKNYECKQFPFGNLRGRINEVSRCDTRRNWFSKDDFL